MVEVVSDPPDRGFSVNDEGDVEWNDARFPMFFIGLGVIAGIGVALSPDSRPIVIAIGLVVLAVSPWVLALVGRAPGDGLFVAMVLAPIAVLILLGETLGLVDLDGGAAQIILMLMIGIVGQMAGSGSRNVVIGTVIASLALVSVGAIVRGDPLDFAPWWIGILLAATAGRAFRSSVLRQEELRLAQAQLTEQEMTEERRRIAREVHDIVAHTMSVTMLHLTAARLALHEDPQAAEEALLEAEKNGRASMDDIRRVVRLLRSDESSLAAALPDDADLEALVERYREAGPDVFFEQSGDPGRLAPAARLAVYRVVQESLSNAVRHGSGEIRASVRHGDTATDIEVVNGASLNGKSSRGAGTTGMAERVEALGGTLEIGPDVAGSRWRVRARIPT